MYEYLLVDLQLHALSQLAGKYQCSMISGGFISNLCHSLHSHIHDHAAAVYGTYRCMSASNLRHTYAS